MPPKTFFKTSVPSPRPFCKTGSAAEPNPPVTAPNVIDSDKGSSGLYIAPIGAPTAAPLAKRPPKRVTPCRAFGKPSM